MGDGDIDYSRYTLRELEEAFAGISKHKYPKNYQNLCSAYAQLTSKLPPEPRAELPVAIDEEEGTAPREQYDAEGRYIPNHIPKGERVSHIIFSLLLFAYGTFGVWVNDLYVPGRRSRGVHLHDSLAWVMYGAILCACLVMLSVVIDHYDQRNNEVNYRSFASLFKGIGWIFFILSMVLSLFR